MKATKSTIEKKAFTNHEKDRALKPKYQTPDNYWCDWFEKGYREAETEAEERHAQELERCKSIFESIRDTSSRLTVGNVSHHKAHILGMASRMVELLSKKLNER